MSSSPASAAVSIRPLTAEDLPRLEAWVREPSVAEWWGPWSGDVAGELMHPDETTFAIEVAGELAGWLGAWEESEPRSRHGGLDIFLGPSFQGRGHGRAALRLGARWLIEERGHHRITIDPAAANARAIACYEAVGFRRVGVTRASEQGLDGGWRDGLLMDLLAEEFDPTGE